MQLFDFPTMYVTENEIVGQVVTGRNIPKKQTVKHCKNHVSSTRGLLFVLTYLVI